MDSYIVRIYRRVRTAPGSMVGIVNNVATGSRRAFKTVDELWTVLNETVNDPKTGTRRSNDNKKREKDDGSS